MLPHIVPILGRTRRFEVSIAIREVGTAVVADPTTGGATFQGYAPTVTGGTADTITVQSFSNAMTMASFAPSVVATGGVPDAPSNCIASWLSATSMDISWTDNSDDETAFVIERRNVTASESFAEVDTAAANSTSNQETFSYILGHTYAWQIKARNAVGDSGPSNIATFIPNPDVSELYPNEPNGFSLICEHDAEILPAPLGAGGGSNVTGEWSASERSMSDGQGGTAYGRLQLINVPGSPGPPGTSDNVFQITWPQYWDHGVGPCKLYGWSDGHLGSPYEFYEQLYTSQWVRLGPGQTDFENQYAVGIKILGYISGGWTNQQNQYYLQLRDPATGPPTADTGPWAMRIRLGGNPKPEGEPFISNYLGTGFPIIVNQWQHWEALYQLNDNGVGNGTYRCWIDGNLHIEETEVYYINTINPGHYKYYPNEGWSRLANKGFYEYHNDPVFGGNSGERKSRDDHLQIAHIYCSGILQDPQPS